MILAFFIALIISIILAILLVLIFMICISKLEINIKNMYINSRNKRKNNERALIKLSLKIGKWNWLKIKLNKEKLANLYAKLKIQEYTNGIKFDNMKKNLETSAKVALKNRKLKKLVKSTNIEVEKFNANIAVGTEDYILTSYIVAIISIAISNILPHVIKEDEVRKNNISKIIHYRIVPIYRDNNEYNVHLTIIASTKVLHLIRIFIEFIKMSKKENKRIKQFAENKDEINVRPV